MVDDLNCMDVETEADNSESIDLPDLYDNTSVFLMAVDPSLVHVIWQVTNDDLQKVKQQCGSNLSNGLFVLKFFDTEHDSSDISVPSSLEVTIDLDDKKCYVPLQETGKSYFTDLVFKTADGDFFTIARSNVAETPQESAVYNIPNQNEPATCEPGPIPTIGAINDESIRDNGIVIDLRSAKDVIPASLCLQGKEQRLAKILNNQYINAIEILKNPDAIPYWPYESIKPSLLPSVNAFCNCPGQYEMVYDFGCDLTEMAERKFISGVSSS